MSSGSLVDQSCVSCVSYSFVLFSISINIMQSSFRICSLYSHCVLFYQDVIEVYPLSSISVVQHISEDSDLNSVLLFTTQQTDEKYAATHLFQSDRVPVSKTVSNNVSVSSISYFVLFCFLLFCLILSFVWFCFCFVLSCFLS